MTGWDLLPAVLKNISGTLALTAAVIAASTVLALVLAPLTRSPHRLVRLPMKAYTYIGRALPPLTFLFGAFFGLAAAGVQVAPFMAAFIAFVVFATAYNIEIIRGGLEAVPRGQYEAARSLGVPPRRAMLGLIMPQALRIATPAYLTRMTGIVKDTSLASVIGVSELTAAAGRMVVFEPDAALLLYGAVGLVYFALASVIIAVQHLLERRFPPSYAK